MNNELLKKTVLVLLVLVLFFGGLYFAAPFLKPLAVAFLIALLMLKVSRQVESKGASRLWSSVISLTIVLTFLGVIIGLFAYQANQMSDNSDELERKGKQKLEELQKGIQDRTGLTSAQLDAITKKIGKSKVRDNAKKVVSGILNSLTDLLLTLIYAFLFLYYRSHFKKFVLKWFEGSERRKAKESMEEFIDIALQYLGGKFILIGILAVVYSAGLTLLGVKYGIFYGVLASLLTLIPFIGNLIGASFPVLMSIIYNDTTTTLAVLGLFALVQFVESYLLQPLIVGKKVNLNPMMTIIIAVLGGMLWGVPGMIIAIPYLGIVLIIFQKIDSLKPVAYLLGAEAKDDDDN